MLIQTLLTFLVCIEKNYVWTKKEGENDRYLDCGLDRNRFYRLISLPHSTLMEIGDLVELGQTKFWVGKTDYWTNLEGLTLDPTTISRMGFDMEFDVEYEWLF